MIGDTDTAGLRSVKNPETVSVFCPKSEHPPAQHVSQAYKAHVSQLKGAAMTRLKELLTEVQSHPLHLQQSQSPN